MEAKRRVLSLTSQGADGEKSLWRSCQPVLDGSGSSEATTVVGGARRWWRPTAMVLDRVGRVGSCRHALNGSDDRWR
ncbi:hypothetical protein E2562_003620 [Oryza meyeriana var. granulata]|uniref:Uncharacterized protein n=1 Tax=Oryza meyeriana var. granulata TaxID=110450 RepID=A0A6G1CNH5_9ORYZ|nr:hypothetical protein E2562_003620 [Oryza meyeriana var. granulata]